MDSGDQKKIPDTANNNDISASELDSNVDHCQTNLKILSQVKVGDKLCYDSDNKKFIIDAWSYTQPLTRWLGSEGRKPTIRSLEEFINMVFKTIDSVYSSEMSENYTDVENTYYTNVNSTSFVFRQENSALLLMFINEMRNAIGGINNLKQTYISDVATISSLDIVIEKMNVRVKKIQSILQINRPSQDAQQ